MDTLTIDTAHLATATDPPLTHLGGSRPAVPPVRRISFAERAARIPHDFMGDDIVMSHLVAALSSVFPEGEAFFVRSVRHYRDRITDPVLRAQVAGFIGQESVHGREHRTINRALAAVGYPTERIDRFAARGIGRDEARSRPERNLAVTAALEHYTATMAEMLLESDELRGYFRSPEMHDLLVWHAIEESEHRAVAFDVYQEVCGDDRLRRRTMIEVSIGFLVSTLIHTLLSLAGDPAARNPRRLFRSLRRAVRSPLVSRDFVRRLRAYNRPGFHPDDRDTTALLDMWRGRLPGSEESVGADAAERK